MKAGTHTIDRARELTEFCLANGNARVFKGWPVKTLFEYCFFHLVDGGAFVCRQSGQIVGAMFAWAMPLEEIQHRNKLRKPVFDWRRSRSFSDALFVAEVMGKRKPFDSLTTLFKLAAARWPDWERKRIFTYRGTRLVELSKESVQRLIFGTDGKWKNPHPGRRCPDTKGRGAVSSRLDTRH